MFSLLYRYINAHIYQEFEFSIFILIFRWNICSIVGSWELICLIICGRESNFHRMLSSTAEYDGAVSTTSHQAIDRHIHYGHTRCDEDILRTSPEYFLGSAVHDTLSGVGLIEDYRVYRKDDHDEVSCILKFGDKLNGHPGIVHGGIIATALDNTFGWLFTALKYPPSFTANLNINFR